MDALADSQGYNLFFNEITDKIIKCKFINGQQVILTMLCNNAIHADVHRITAYNDKLYVLSDGGVSLISHPTYNSNYGIKSINGEGLCIGEGYKLAVAPDDPSNILVGQQDNGSKESYTGFENSWEIVYDLIDGGEQSMASRDEKITSACYGNNFPFKYGKYHPWDPSHFINKSNPYSQGAWARPWTGFIEYNVEDNMFYSAYNEIYRLDDPSPNPPLFTKMTEVFVISDPCPTMIDNFCFDPSQSNMYYASITPGGNGCTGPWLNSALVHCGKTLNPPGFVSTLLHPEYQGVDNILHTITGKISSIVAEGSQVQLWISGMGYEHTSINPGGIIYDCHVMYRPSISSDWENFSAGLPNLPVHKLVYEKGSQNRLYAGTEVGVYYRDASMDQWEKYGKIPNVMVYDLDINYCSRKIYASTYGRGIWAANLPKEDLQSVVYESISQSQSWSTDNEIYNNIVIENGAELTISDCTIKIARDRKIIVKPGGKLYLKRAKLTSYCSSSLWKGIEIAGNSFLPQTNISNQGFVEITQNSTIENARCGILACGTYIDVNGDEQYDLHATGGIVFAYNSNFHNCITGVKFNRYDFDNISYLGNCQFVTDIQPLINSEDPDYFIWLDEVTSIDIRGCTFNNATADKAYGHGIFSYNSYFKVHNDCPPEEDCIRNEFHNLNYAIYALGLNNARFIDINKCIFDSNKHGIFISDINLAEIMENDFNITSLDYGTADIYGLYLEDCNGYHVEANQFIGADEEEPQCIGIYISKWEAPYNNLVYNNLFDNLQFGVIATGENRYAEKLSGLEIRCNDFYNTKNDIIVQPQQTGSGPLITNHTGIAPYQGNNGTLPTDPAGNLFTSGIAVNLNYDNAHGGKNIRYFYHSTGAPNLVPSPYAGLINLNLVNVSYQNKSTACPSKIEPGGHDPGEEKNKMSTAKFETDIIQDSLDLLVDGGNTITLTQDVALSTPEEAIEIRDNLLSKSPFLSDTVMATAIVKENVLTNAIVRDVMVSNPQSAKSEDLMQAIENRSDTMPQYMKDQILAGQNILGGKEILESSLSFNSQNYYEALYNLMRCYYNDSVSYQKVDSINQTLSNINNLWSDYQRVANYFLIKDTLSAGYLLDSIPSKFSLTVQESERYDATKDFYYLYTKILNNSLGFQVLDSNLVNALIQLYSSEFPPNSSLARNTLIANKRLKYEEPIYLSESNSSRQKIKPKTVSTDLKLIRVFPNPAKGFVTVEYQLKPDELPARLCIFDSRGALSSEYKIYREKDQIIIPTRELTNGAYLISIMKGNTRISTAKFTVLSK
ncbi:MAG: T9SS type A sorting domain-containing protein [Bacteroidales bacterium]